MKPETGSGSSSCGQLDSEPSCCAIWINCTGEATGKDERARAGLHRSRVGEGIALLGRYFVFISSSFLSVALFFKILSETGPYRRGGAQTGVNGARGTQNTRARAHIQQARGGEVGIQEIRQI